MKNFIQPANVVTVTAPADVESGDLVLVGAIVGVAACTVQSGEQVEVRCEGAFDLAKVAGDALTQGAIAKAGADGIVAAAGTRPIGWVLAAAGAGTTTVLVKLCPGIGGAAATFEAETARRPAKSAA